MRVRVATRGSRLAVTQTEWVMERLREAHPEITFEQVVFRTVGDKVLDVPLSEIGGKGLFTKELEDALLEAKAEMAVHSLKDMPTEFPDGLVLGAVPVREDPRDVVITADGTPLSALPAGSVVGTSSLRRVAQLRAQRPDLKFAPIRGNVDTRLRKLREGQVAALVMAASGLHRVGLTDQITEYLDPGYCLPAPGQGALAIEIRSGESEISKIVGAIHDDRTALAVQAERTVLAKLQGGCQVPIGAHAVSDRGHLRLTGLVAALDGSRVVRCEREGLEHEAGPLGEQVAEWLLKHGGAEILSSMR